MRPTDNRGSLPDRNTVIDTRPNKVHAWPGMHRLTPSHITDRGANSNPTDCQTLP
mgnify:CR=1 FL=1